MHTIEASRNFAVVPPENSFAVGDSSPGLVDPLRSFRMRLSVAVVLLVCVASRLAAQSADIVADGPREFGEMIRRDTARWREVVKTANIKID